jgi:hypothetical protein
MDAAGAVVACCLRGGRNRQFKCVTRCHAGAYRTCPEPQLAVGWGRGPSARREILGAVVEGNGPAHVVCRAPLKEPSTVSYMKSASCRSSVHPKASTSCCRATFSGSGMESRTCWFGRQTDRGKQRSCPAGIVPRGTGRGMTSPPPRPVAALAQDPIRVLQ